MSNVAAVSMSHSPSIAVYKIDKNNPNYKVYVDRLKSADKTDYIRISKHGKFRPFYVIYGGEHMLGAASIVLNRLKTEEEKLLYAKVSILYNAKVDKETTFKIQSEGYQILYDEAKKMCEEKLQNSEEMEYKIDFKPKQIIKNKA